MGTDPFDDILGEPPIVLNPDQVKSVPPRHGRTFWWDDEDREKVEPNMTIMVYPPGREHFRALLIAIWPLITLQDIRGIRYEYPLQHCDPNSLLSEDHSGPFLRRTDPEREVRWTEDGRGYIVKRR